eukprot:100410_1
MASFGLKSLHTLYGTAWKKGRTTELVVQAISGGGFRGVDTACQPKHYSEELVGEAIVQLTENHGFKRGDLWIQTKFSPLNCHDLKGQVPYDINAPLDEQVKQSIQKSLQNLKIQKIDSLVLHDHMPTHEENMTVWRQFEHAVDAGTVSCIGVSNFYDLKVLKNLFKHARIKPSIVQNRFYSKTDFDKDIRDFCIQNDIIYQSFWTLTANPALLGSSEVQSISKSRGITPEQVVYRFMVEIGCQPLSGTTDLQHMKEAVCVKDFCLSGSEVDSIMAVL